MDAVTPTFSPSRSDARLASRRSARGFTLTEVLVTVGIIILVVSLGVPVFNALRGSRSTEAGMNVVSAIVGQARTIAVNEGRYAGAMFFVDPRNGRTSVAIVTITDPAQDPDPYDKYRGWLGPAATGWPASGASQQYYVGDVASATPRLGDRVIRMTQDEAASGGVSFAAGGPRTGVPSHIEAANGGFGGAYGRPTVRLWYAKTDHSSSTGNAPKAAGDGTVAGDFDTGDWTSSPNRISLYGGTDFTLLPEGVGVQVMIQQLQARSSNSDIRAIPNTSPLYEAALSPTFADNAADSFVGLGVIMFDPTGNMSFRTYTIQQTSPLGQLLQLTTDATGIPAGIGLVVYDKVLFDSAGFTVGDYTYTSVQPANAPRAQLPLSPVTAALLPRPTNAHFYDGSASSEYAEELWLMRNGTPFYINRFSGMVTQGN
jgi:type II secretory pathway pseudopilin PulG